MIFEGKTALVTGASGGIGGAIAVALARRGALVALHYGTGGDAAKALANRIHADGGRAFAVSADLRSVTAIKAMFTAVDREFEVQTGERTLDILVNNAGAGGGAYIRNTTEAQFDAVFDLNVKGLFFVTQEAIPRLRDGGRVLNISSAAARGAQAPRAVYSASKLAVNGLTLSMAQELAPRRITVNALAPGAVDTNLISALKADPKTMAAIEASTAFGRVGQPEDIANAALLLLSPEASWVTGQVLEASGGLRL